MKILEIGDLHLSLRKPTNRLDKDYLGTILNKLDQCYQIAYSENCSAIVQVGDFFDTPIICDRLKTILIEKMKSWVIPVYAIYGQHDISGHNASTFQRSPLRLLEASGILSILDNSETICYSQILDKSGDVVSMYGASFGQDIPVPQVSHEFNVLVIHAMIGNKPLFPGHELKHPKAFLKQHPEYDLVLVGDYHYAFEQEYQGRWMLNAGALIRKTISQRDQELIPSVKIFDTVKKEVKTIPLKVDDVDSILNINTKKKETDSNEDLQEFIKSLREEGSGQKVNWQTLLLDVYRERKINKNVRQIIDNTTCKIRGDA